MEDLSKLLSDPVTALAPVSMAGGNMMSDNKLAGTAPGSEPVYPVPSGDEQTDPEITTSNSRQIRPGGRRPGPRTWSPPGAPSWKPAGHPGTSSNHTEG